MTGADPPRCTVFVAGSGVGQTFGQSALATASRIRWPAANRHAVASISISSSYTSPGVSGSGSVSDSRRVAFSMPFATRCDEPSGATSLRLTAKPITRRRRRDVQDDPRSSDDVHGLLERLGRVDERERLVQTLIAGLPELEAA